MAPLRLTVHFSPAGPLTPPGTGCFAVQNVADVSSAFRIVGTGVVLDTDKSAHVVKKLKLTGQPFKVQRGWCWGVFFVLLAGFFFRSVLRAVAAALALPIAFVAR